MQPSPVRRASKKTIQEGLLSFFEGDEERTQGALDAIENSREDTERQVLSLTGIKNKDKE